MFANKSLKILQLLLLVLTLAGCSPQSAPPTDGQLVQHLNYGLAAHPAQLDPGKVADDSGLALVNAIFEGLVRLKPDGTYDNAMAASWEVTNKGARYIFTLRESNWANGLRVTAHDFEYAWKRALNPDNKGAYVHMLYTVKNAEGYHNSLNEQYRLKKYSVNEVGIRAENENTLVVDLVQPDPAFIKKLIYPVFSPLPQSLCEADPAEYFQARNIVGNGPFVIMQYETGIKYELCKNEAYWDKDNVRLASMTWFLIGGDVKSGWQMYKNNRLDLFEPVLQSELAEGLLKKSVRVTPVLANYIYQINTIKKPFDDIRVRRALSCALDRQTLIDKVLRGAQLPSEGLVPTGIAEQTGGDFRQNGGRLLPDNDTAEANRLLSEAGYPGGQGFPVLEILTGEEPEHYYLAEALCEEWQEKLGIEAVVVQAGWQERFDIMQKGSYDLGLSGFVANIADAAEFLEKCRARSIYNHTGWKNGEYERLLKDAAAAGESERSMALHAAEELLMAELPVLPVYDYTRAYAARGGLSGVFLPPAGPKIEFKWAYRE